MNFKIERKKQYAHLSKEEAKNQIVKVDKKRKEYYESFTKQKWGDKSNYDLFIDTSKIGVDNSVNLILEYVNLFIHKGKE